MSLVCIPLRVPLTAEATLTGLNARSIDTAASIVVHRHCAVIAAWFKLTPVLK